MPELAKLAKGDVEELSVKLRDVASDAATSEECAQRWCFHLYDNLTQASGNSACALVRCFRTARYSELTTELCALASQVAGTTDLPPSTPCLVLMGSAGDDPDWNSRHRSSGHRVIPLPSAEIVARSPMIAHLFRQLGIDVHEVVAPSMESGTTPATALNVFHVPDAKGSPHIPAQEDFVIPYRVRTVFGFGGVLSGGNVFAFIIFTKIHLPLESANLFQELAENLRLGFNRFERPGMQVSP